MREKYLFIRAHYDKRVASMEPLGVEYLMACLKAEGAEGMIHDEGLYGPIGRFSRIKHLIEKNNITFVGLSCMSNTTWYDLELARRIKKCYPHIRIMVGGPEVVINRRDFELDDIDFIYYDNGLESFRLAVKNDFSENGWRILFVLPSMTIIYFRIGLFFMRIGRNTVYLQREHFLCSSPLFPVRSSVSSACRDILTVVPIWSGR